MHKKLSLTLTALCAMVLFGAGCGSGSDGGGTSIFGGNNSPSVTGEICSAFPAAWVGESLGKPIVKTDVSLLGIRECKYYLSYDEAYYKLPNGATSPGGPNVTIIQENLDIETIKRGYEYGNGSWKSGEGFAMEAVLMYNSKGHLVDVDIVLGPKDYVRLNSLNKALTEEELIAFGKKVAEYIKSGKAQGTEPASETSEGAANSTGSADAESTVDSFFGAIGKGDPASAVDLMDANQQTKNMWKDSFGAISSLTVKSLEPIYQSEWTAERETYKAKLEVKTKGGNTYGWENGDNTRWVTLQKSDGKWLVHELANNP